MKHDYRIILVVDRHYGERLKTLPKDTPAWIVDSPANRPVIDELRKERAADTHPAGITSFKDVAEASPEKLAVSMLNDVELHHGSNSTNPRCNILQIVGAPMTRALDDALNRLDFLLRNVTPTALEYRRPNH